MNACFSHTKLSTTFILLSFAARILNKDIRYSYSSGLIQSRLSLLSAPHEKCRRSAFTREPEKQLKVHHSASLSCPPPIRTFISENNLCNTYIALITFSAQCNYYLHFSIDTLYCRKILSVFFAFEQNTLQLNSVFHFHSGTITEEIFSIYVGDFFVL